MNIVILIMFCYFYYSPYFLEFYVYKRTNMKLKNIAGQKNVDKYVSSKLETFSKSEKTMETLYKLMFSEKTNVFAEETDGYRIKKITYQECQNLIDKMAKKLSFLLKDIPYNSMIGIDLPNSLDWIVVFWGLLKAGYKPLLINSRVGIETINEIIKKFSIMSVISDTAKLEVKTFTLSEIEKCVPPTDMKTSGFANEVFLMSSNTSGSLKICGYTGEEFYYQICDSANIIHTCKQIKKHYNGELKLLTFLPFYHIFGLVAVYIWFTFFSRTLVFLKDNDPKTIVNTIKKHQITHIFSVPLFWETIYKTAKNTISSRGEKTYKKFIKGLKLYNFLSRSSILSGLFSRIAFKEIRENLFGDSIEFLISGGGAISKDVLLFFNAIGYHLANGYGATEIGITSVELTSKPKTLLSGSVGHPFQSLEYKINENGELLVKGKSTAHSIYIDGESKKVSNDDWYNTHDISICKKGRFFINGRIDDLIICSHGENINPNFVEPKLKVGGIQNLCLFGVSEKENTYSVLLAEICSYLGSKEINIVLSNLKSIIQKENLSYAVQRIVFTSSPLLDDNDFKVNREKIRNRYINSELTIVEVGDDSKNEDIDSELLQKVTNIFASALNVNCIEIKKNAHFFYDLGGSSLEYFTMITGVQNEFNVPFPVIDQNSLATVEQICEYIKDITTKI